MKICVPTEDDGGLDAATFDHFGSAPYFTVVDTEGGDPEVVPNRGHRHRAGQCHPLEHLHDRGIDAVVCRGLGRRAYAALAQGEIEVLVSKKETVREVIEAVRSGEAERLSEDEACAGHGHGHRHGRGHGGGTCR